MKKKTHVESYNLKMAFLFFVLVFILLLISASFKVLSVAAKSKFDARHRFTFGVYKEKSFFYTFSFSPETESLSLLNLSSANLPVKNNDLKKDEGQLEEYLAVPVDGFIYLPSEKEEKKEIEKDQVDDMLLNAILNYRSIKTRLTFVDLFRLWMFARTVSPRDVLTKDFSGLKENFMIDKLSSSLFNDNSLSKEKSSIQIYNGTDISGFGNKVARILTNSGANIVAVSTSDSKIETSEILYFDKKTYTVEKVGKVLGIQSIKSENKPGIADITIKLGKDASKFLPE